MQRTTRQSGFTLVEMLVVVAIIGVMVAIAVPGMGPLMRNQKLTSAQNLVRTALQQAQAYAIKEQTYAGLRFQCDKDGWRNGRQYMVLVRRRVEDLNNYIFEPVPNVQPLALADGIVALDQRVLTNSFYNYTNIGLRDDPPGPGSMLDDTTFTIVFSPSGRVITREILIRPRDYLDAVVNVEPAVVAGDALIVCDGYYAGHPNYGNCPAVAWVPGGAGMPSEEATAAGLVISLVDPIAGLGPGERIDYVRTLPRQGQHFLLNLYTGQRIRED